MCIFDQTASLKMKLTAILVLKIRFEILYFLNILYERDAASTKIIFSLKGKNLEIKHINAIKCMF